MNTQTIQANFHNPQKAQKAVERLRDAGFRAGDIFIINAREGHDPEDQQNTTTLRLKTRSPGYFMATYAISGAITGGLVGLFSMEWIPWVHHIARHHLHAIVLGGILGTMFATIAGALLHVDEIKADTKEIDGRMFEGSIKVCVEPEDETMLSGAERVLKEAGALSITRLEHPIEGGRLKTWQIE